MLCDEEYARLKAVFAAMAKQSDGPQEQTRWLALVKACQELLKNNTRTRLDAHWSRAA
jgi:hypothetical protein